MDKQNRGSGTAGQCAHALMEWQDVFCRYGDSTFGENADDPA